MKPQFLKLRNGAIIRFDDIQMILRKDINDFFIVLKQQELQPRADGHDVDFITENLVEIISVPEPPKEEVKTRLLVQE